MTKEQAGNRLNQLWNSNVDLNDKNVLKEINQLTTILSNDVEIISKSYVNIRLLSQDEYDTYIKNGTLNGSITANDQNVWNYKNVPGISFIYNYNSRYWENYKNHMKNPNNVICLSGGNPSNYIHDADLYTDMLLDNDSDKCLSIRQSEGQYDCYYLDMASNVRVSSPLEISNVVSTKKNEGYLIITNRPDHNTHLCLTIRFRVDYFRPVFQYQDNAKSGNVFY